MVWATRRNRIVTFVSHHRRRRARRHGFTLRHLQFLFGKEHDMKRIARVAGVIAFCGGALLAGCSTPGGPWYGAYRTERVLLLSIDGLHHSDLVNWVRDNPESALAELAAKGITYANARTPVPSDSFPGLLALVTGGTPKVTGVYYDDSYDRTLFAPGSNCTIPAGTEVVYDETIDFDSAAVFSGGINPANLPLKRDGTHDCKPVYPHEFLAVNTAFEVLRAKGVTAWADKHPAYDLVNGPSGAGVVDLYTPEINAKIKTAGIVNGLDLAGVAVLCDGTNSLPVARVSAFTDCIPAVEAYDDTKVQAILHQINGRSSDGRRAQPVPVLFGMNFQAVSVGQKLPVGGYLDANASPSPSSRRLPPPAGASPRNGECCARDRRTRPAPRRSGRSGPARSSSPQSSGLARRTGPRRRRRAR